MDDLPRPIVERLVGDWVINPNHFWTPYPLPSVPASDPKFMPGNPRGFIWRGPSWINTNWFLSHGLRRHGYGEIADAIVAKSHECIEKSGFREYYHPYTAEGIGRTQLRMVYADIRYVGCVNAPGTVIAAENADTRRFLRASAFARGIRKCVTSDPGGPTGVAGPCLSKDVPGSDRMCSAFVCGLTLCPELSAIL